MMSQEGEMVASVEDASVKRPKLASTHVRFSEAEYRQIHRDEEARGMSIPQLLKDAYFHGKAMAILMSHEDQVRWIAELMRQGHNVNQIAKRLNAGVGTVMERELMEISRLLRAIGALITGKLATVRA